jgi:class II poly(R)-hydroxyalkanoic acid synthase
VSNQQSNGNGDERSSLGVMLTDAASAPGSRWFPGRAGVEVAARLAARPDRIAKRSLGLAGELAKIAAGRSEVEPPKGDRRFKDPAWQGNPAFRRLAQSYLATSAAADGLVGDAGASWRAERRARFTLENVFGALAPTNFPALNPAVYKATLDSGGANFVKGTRQLVGDMASRPRIPSMVDGRQFEVGENIAVTPGQVVLRTPVFELIQYRPVTSRVRTRPLLIVPPMINKYYVVDLAPERSMIEYLVAQGQQVFAMSWRNPDERHAEWGLDTYVQAILDALEATEDVSGADKAHVMGLCAGGIVLACALGHLAASGDADRVAGLTLAVCVLDTDRAGTTGALVDDTVAAAAVADSAQRGYLDGKALAGVFAWLRPNDLIWNYWVNNYLLGKDPPAFDILYWNADTTRMPAALHRDFIEVSLENPLTRSGELEVLGTPVDLKRVTLDSYIVAGIADHITPWQNAYRTTQMLGSEPRFVLSTSGHIAAMVNPPGNEKASFQVHETNPETAEEWLQGAHKRRGSWWEDWSDWLGERSGPTKTARKTLGNKKFKAQAPAPGAYVLEK